MSGVACSLHGTRDNPSASRVRAVQFDDDPTHDCGSGSDTYEDGLSLKPGDAVGMSIVHDLIPNSAQTARGPHRPHPTKSAPLARPL
eukprot:CAMPEP_0174323526 /NCGR_PEP_ID=MMETSP0810-20121108/11874_1 /TAXON_ID=73025 ORGANISM="Eutreptiella gymnastica-like, Strain CCMP1594" /NCGR_SAMPLE_ID=MMETSP0810 /ASSEMBLY_ACC=CAM_ASM_000659 /LENGTH=86 /DNA_ID=CAMNT_0015435999 /DNA_START=452 /DNA_END=712 /DNA_ORIENTATION=+